MMFTENTPFEYYNVQTDSVELTRHQSIFSHMSILTSSLIIMIVMVIVSVFVKFKVPRMHKVGVDSLNSAGYSHN